MNYPFIIATLAAMVCHAEEPVATSGPSAPQSVPTLKSRLPIPPEIQELIRNTGRHPLCDGNSDGWDDL